MSAKNTIQLIALAAIWGGSFLFMRQLAPQLGPLLTADLRVLIGGSALLLYFWFRGYNCEWKRYWRAYLVIGVLNSAIPFSLYAFAALHLPASYEVILNSSSPLFGAIFSMLWLNDKLTRGRSLGLVLGAFGVMFVAQSAGSQIHDEQFGWSVAACLLAAACYGLAAIYIKVRATGAKPKAIAGASQLLAGLALLPLLGIAPPPSSLHVDKSVTLNALGLAILCSSVAYLLYYRLIEEAGPTKALTVTFLMPVFGMLWGHLFLDEIFTRSMISGCLLILAGTALVVIKRRECIPVHVEPEKSVRSRAPHGSRRDFAPTALPISRP